MTCRLLTVKPSDNYTLIVTFQNGIIKRYDTKPLFQVLPVFQILLQVPGLFEQVKVDIGGAGISWNDELDLAAEDLWEDGIELRFTAG